MCEILINASILYVMINYPKEKDITTGSKCIRIAVKILLFKYKRANARNPILHPQKKKPCFLINQLLSRLALQLTISVNEIKKNTRRVFWFYFPGQQNYIQQSVQWLHASERETEGGKQLLCMSV